jgi:hypothetical protein
MNLSSNPNVRALHCLNDARAQNGARTLSKVVGDDASHLIAARPFNDACQFQ